jgi:hypothetical protein
MGYSFIIAHNHLLTIITPRSILADIKNRRYRLGVFSREPKLDKDGKIDEEERAACLRYLKTEIKLLVFRDKEYNLYKIALSEYCESSASDSKKTKEMCRAANRLLQATEHILKCRADMEPIPDIALKNYSLWQSVHIDYNAYTKANSQYWEEEDMGLEPNNKYLTTCESRIIISARKANGEMNKLYQRFRLSDEVREMQDEAIAVYDAENWQPRQIEE